MQFELPEIAELLEGASGSQGVWSNAPPEIELRHPVALPQLKEAYASMKAIAEDGEGGLEFIKGVFTSVLQQPLNNRPPLLNESTKQCCCAERLSNYAVFGQKPTLSELTCIILSRVSAQNWKLVGVVLLGDIADSKKVLDAISHQVCDDRNRFLEMLSYWLENGSSVTWKTLMDTLGLFETKRTVDEMMDIIVSVLGGADQVSVYSCFVLTEGVLCCGLPGLVLLFFCVCLYNIFVLLSSQVVTMSGPWIPVTSSSPVVRGGTVAAERSYPRVKDIKGTRTMFIGNL